MQIIVISTMAWYGEEGGEGEKACWRRVVRSLPPLSPLLSLPTNARILHSPHPALLLPLPPSMLSTGILHTPQGSLTAPKQMNFAVTENGLWTLLVLQLHVVDLGHQVDFYIVGPRLNRLPFPLIPLPHVLSQQITTHPNYRFLHHLSGSPLPAIPVTRVSNDKFDINQGELRQSANLVSCMV